MMKLFVAAAFAALALPAFAGGGSCLKSGYRCENACPLAQKANVCRALGTEALASSPIARADVSKVVLDNLARI
jgi:hypothetical protein